MSNLLDLINIRLKKITQRLSSLRIVSSEILSYTAVGYWCQWDSNPSTLIILLESIHMQENGLSGSLNIPTGHNGAKNLLKISRFDEFFHLYFSKELLEDFNNDFGFWNTILCPKMKQQSECQIENQSKINPKSIWVIV